MCAFLQDAEGARWLPEMLVQFAGRIPEKELENEDAVTDVAVNGISTDDLS